MSPRPAKLTTAELRRVLVAVAEAPLPYAIQILPDGTVNLTPQSLHQTQATAQAQLAYRKEIRL